MPGASSRKRGGSDWIGPYGSDSHASPLPPGRYAAPLTALVQPLASRQPAQSHATTGTHFEARAWTPDGDQVTTRAIHKLDGNSPQQKRNKERRRSDRAPSNPWALQLKKATDVTGTPSALPERALQVPVDVRGHDWMGDLHALAALRS